MNKSEIKSNWSIIKQKLKQNYPYLMESDLMHIEGEEEELFEKLQKKIGISREEFIFLIYLYVLES